MRGSRSMPMGLGVLGSALALVASGCSGGSGSAATILVDYSHDEFATQFIRYFPDRVQVHPGDSITFRQTWTGEPHTVTLGTLVQEVLDVTVPLVEEYGDLPDEEIPEEVFEAYFAAECSLETLFGGFGCFDEEGGEEDEEGGEDEGEGPAGDELNQAIAQPCLIVEGTLPDDGGPCETQELPPFQGTEAYYNSGVIPYEGPKGNVFELELAETIEPGEYGFYCAVHGSFQSGTIEVVPADQDIPPASDVAAMTREQVNQVLAPFRTAFERAQQDGEFVYGGQTFEGNFSGLVPGGDDGLLNEFVPKRLEVTTGEPVTWLMFGPHSISFDVPEYFPILEFLEDGTVRGNDDLFEPAGGAPEPPDMEGPPGVGDDGDQSLVIDGGTYDGSGFWSSGVLYGEPLTYILRFSTPGTYEYACLIHPPMVGTVVVTD